MAEQQSGLDFDGLEAAQAVIQGSSLQTGKVAGGATQDGGEQGKPVEQSTSTMEDNIKDAQEAAKEPSVGGGSGGGGNKDEKVSFSVDSNIADTIDQFTGGAKESNEKAFEAGGASEQSMTGGAKSETAITELTDTQGMNNPDSDYQKLASLNSGQEAGYNGQDVNSQSVGAGQDEGMKVGR
jgi:hypothetical protein